MTRDGEYGMTGRPPPMALDRFRDLLDAYGADPHRWPTDRRAAAEALVAASVEARAARDEAAALDRMLDLAPAPAPSPELMARVLAAAPRGAHARRRGWLTRLFAGLDPAGTPFRPAGALAAALILGVLTGFVMGSDGATGSLNGVTLTNVDALAFGPIEELESSL